MMKTYLKGLVIAPVFYTLGYLIGVAFELFKYWISKN